jgi:dipeptidyl-peptidase-4
VAEEIQADDPAILTLEKIYNSREFAPQRFGPARWHPRLSGYTTLEASKTNEGGRDIVYYSPAGKRNVLVKADLLVPAGAEEALAIRSYTWSPDGKMVMIFTNTQRVWRQNTRGDYWILDLKKKKLWQLGGDAPESSLMFTKFSPDSAKVAYVSERNIYVQTLASGAVTQLTGDGSDTIINGTSDWVYEEEFYLRDGFRWSPDSRWIAYWQFDTKGVRDFYMINNTDELYSKPIPIQYPKAGETNSATKIGVVSHSGGATTWFTPKGDPRQHYIPRMDWADNSSQVIIQRMNRSQNTNTVMLGDIATGGLTTIMEEKDDAWLDINDTLLWVKKGAYFTWLSERSGWRHLYLVSRDGKTVRPVTKGNFDIIRIIKIDPKRGEVYFTASPDNPIQSYLYKASLFGSGNVQRVTPANRPGTHTYRISSDSRWAFHSYSSAEVPSVSTLIRLRGHKKVRTLVANKKMKAKVKAIAKKPVEFFRVPIPSGHQLDAWCLKPPDFDPQKKYPLLIYVYGEPWSMTVRDRWGGNMYLWHLFLAQKGYVVVSVDNRGTPSPRGREFRKCIYGKVGILNSQDQADAIREILKQRTYIDPDRVAVWGWSAGGSNTLNAMFRHPDLYKTGMAIAPVADQRYYDTIYQERYQGHPKDNPEGYTQGSPITHAHNLKGNLLIIHGTGDDNVHYQNTEAVINKLIEHNKPFDMMAYPNRSHGIYEGQNTTLHLFNLLYRYLTTHTPPNPKS